MVVHFFKKTGVSVLLMLLMVLPSGLANARVYGLLVGVSDYPNLHQRYQLQGPGNDVELMRKVLLARGFVDRDITLLKSRSARRPTRANIINELKRLAKKVDEGDFVYLHFAGHGSQQPAKPGDLSEGDGLDEIFLPEDVGHWQDGIGAVEQAISDNELHELIGAIRAQGAFVWAVFDSCHSGTMLRSLGRIKWRNVNARSLGIPVGNRPRWHASNGLSHYAQPSPLAARTEAAEKTAEPSQGGFVAFYAAQTNELAPEMALPPGMSPTRQHGLFSYALAEAMTVAPDVSYRRLGQIVMQKYVKQGMRATTPLIEGSHLEARLFGQQNIVAKAQWPVRLRGTRRNRRLYAPAGRLHQLGKGAILAILKNASDKDEDAMGYARAELVDMFNMQLKPISYGGKSAIDISAIPRSAYVSVIKPAFSFHLKVAMPAGTSAVTKRERRMLQAIRAYAGQASVRNKGLTIDWVQPEAPADLRLVFTPKQQTGEGGPPESCPRNHLWFVDRSGALLCTGARKNMSLQIEQPTASFDENVQQVLRARLNAIGKVRNLEQMVARFQDGRFGRELKVHLYVTERGSSKESRLDSGSRKLLKKGDYVRLEVKNNSRWPVDVTILFVNSAFGIDPLFPTGGKTNRIAPGRLINDLGGNITSDTLGLEGMIIIASKASKGASVADFSFLAQKTLTRTVAVRSLGGETAGRTVNSDSAAFNDLIMQAGFGQGAMRSSQRLTRSVMATSPSTGDGDVNSGVTSQAAVRALKTPFKRVTLKSVRWVVGAE